MVFPYEVEYQLALTLAQQASLIFLPAFHSSKVYSNKSSSTDLVTATDRAIEDLITSRIRSLYPDHNIIGEETTERVTLDDRPTWIIDPIDGTMNFIHCNTSCCIAIGFSVRKEVQFGVIYNPMLKELWTGKLGEGSYCNGMRLSVSGETSLTKALVITGMGASRKPDIVKIAMSNITSITAEPDACHGLRIVGSSVLNICSVARGDADAYFDCGMMIWDVAAASVVLREAGGVVMSVKEGEEFDMCRRRVLVASSEKLGKVIQSKVQHIDYCY